MTGIAGGTMAGASSDLLAVLNNPEVFKQRLEQLQETERKTQAVVDLAGPADEIVRMRKGIEADAEAAKVALDAALDKAESVVEEATNQAKLIVEKGTQEAGRLTAEAQSLHDGEKLALTKAEGAIAAVESAKRTNEARAGELDNQERSLQQKADALASREQELAGEKSKLAAARDAINAAL